MDLSGLRELGAAAAEQRAIFGIVSEMDRITALGLKAEVPVDRLVEKWSRAYRRTASARDLLPAQAMALEQAEWAAGLGMPYGVVGSVGVGKGKTLGFLLLPRVFGAKRPIQLIPPDVKQQTLDDEWEWQREYNVVRTTEDVDEWECARGELRLLVTYGQLSRPGATDLLRRLNPDFIGADESQNLANPRAARTMRFLRYMNKHRGQVRFCPMSGTITQAAMEDYAHLVNLALLDRSPMPRHPRDLELLSGTINWNAQPDKASMLYAQQLVDWAEGVGFHQDEPDLQRAARAALGHRLKTCPGVVVTTSSSCSAPIELTAAHPEMSEDIRGALYLLDVDYELPDGTQVVEAAHFAANANHLSVGFYYRWAWEDTPKGEVDQEWMEARREWSAQVRNYLSRHGREGCDSPFLVETYVRKERKPEGLYGALQRWDRQRKKPPPPVRAVWFDYSILAWVVQWVREREQAIVWFRSRAMGAMLEQFGIPVMWEGTPDPAATPVVALSWHVYHKGWNLQAWSEELDIEPSPNGARWEQKLGRTHREGQQAPVIRSTVLQHTWPFRNNMRAAMEKAGYIEAVTYQPQKLRMAELRGFITEIEEEQRR